MESIVDKFTEAVGVAIPNVVAAAAILVVGWIFAAIVAAVVRRVLHRTSLDDRLAAWALGEEKAAEANVEKAGGKIAFWLVMLFVFVGVFETLGLSLITQPLNEFLNQLFAFAPQLLGAALLIVAAWAVAGLVRMVVSKGLKAARLDERVAGESGEGVEPQAVPLASTIGETAYWLVFQPVGGLTNSAGKRDCLGLYTLPALTRYSFIKPRGFQALGHHHPYQTSHRPGSNNEKGGAQELRREGKELIEKLVERLGDER